MSQRIFSPPSGPAKRGLYGLLNLIVKFPGLRRIHREPVHFSKSAAEHGRRPLSLKTFPNIYYGNRALFGLAIAALLCAPLSVWAVGQTTRVSVASDGTPGNARSAFVTGSAISPDGRYVTFESNASNLVPGDTNGIVDIFVHDRLTGKTSRVSVASDGTQGNGSSQYSAISADGRYLAFISGADNLVSGDTNGFVDIFVHDRKSGKTSRVSVASDGTQANGGHSGGFPAISANGRYVAFDSSADNLVSGDTNGTPDVFVHDRMTGQTTRISLASSGTQGNDNSFGSEISPNGRFVTFQSFADNLVSGDTNSVSDIFIRDQVSGKTSRVSIASSGMQANADSGFYSSISSDGYQVAFWSMANNLVSGDTNGCGDIFVHNRVTNQTTRVNLTSDGAQVSCSNNESPRISADGRYVSFRSDSDSLVPGDVNGAPDIFIHDRKSGKISIAAASENNEKSIVGHAISADARYVAFWSPTGTLVPGTDLEQWYVFVRDRLLLPNKKADLSVTQSESGDPVVKGSQFTYTVKVKNNGRDPASDVNLTDLVPLEQQLLSVTPSQGSCYKAPITVCRLGKLYPGAGAQVRVKLKAIRSGPIKNTASVNAAPKDLAPYNNSSTISTLIK